MPPSSPFYAVDTYSKADHTVLLYCTFIYVQGSLNLNLGQRYLHVALIALLIAEPLQLFCL